MDRIEQIKNLLNKQIQESFERVRNQTPKERAIVILSWHLGCKAEDILDIDFKEENGILTINSFIPKQPIEKMTFTGFIEKAVLKKECSWKECKNEVVIGTRYCQPYLDHMNTELKKKRQS